MDLMRFALRPQVLVGPPNQAPAFTAVGPLTVMPGHRLEVPLTATDPDGDPVTFALRAAGPLPTGTLGADGRLVFVPAPGQGGTYPLTLVASDGVRETTQAVSLTVAADPITSTRISGVIQNTSRQPLAGVPVTIGTVEVMTAADGSFQLNFPGALPSDTLKVHAERLTGPVVYPFIAEKLPLMLEHDVFPGVNNVISRPIFLPPLDTASARMIDPARDTTVTTAAIPGASVFVRAGTLRDQMGGPYSGPLGSTAVPPDLTPAALPENLSPSLVVTIQPGDRAFTQPAPLSLPNRDGWAPGTMMDLWSINPVTGFFDNVGIGQVSADGQVLNTISGGIRNSSWHFFARILQILKLALDSPACNTCEKKAQHNSEVSLHSGGVTEEHSLPTYHALGEQRGVMLVYDSQRADPRPIFHVGYDDINPNIFSVPDALRLQARLAVEVDGVTVLAPGFANPGQFGLRGGENFWTIPSGGGPLDAALQIDLRRSPTGVYNYSLDAGLRGFTGDWFIGSSTVTRDLLAHVNTIDSPFGSGWGLAGLQEIVTGPDGSALIIDGDGNETLFRSATGGGFTAPPGDFTTLMRLADGTFRRTTKDQTVYQFNAQNKLASVRDRNGNETRYLYDAAGKLTAVVDPVGLETVFAYTGARVTSITDPAGRVTQLAYDDKGNLLRVTDADATQRTWEYDGDHHMTAETDKRGNREQSFYDEFGRATRAVRKDGTVTQVNPRQV
jgi:YD repeat-containing protein